MAYPEYQEDTVPMDWKTILGHSPIQTSETSLAGRIHDSLDLITKDTVGNALRRIEHNHPWLTKQRQELLVLWIQKHARRVFVITLLCDLEPSVFIMALSYFKDNGFTDGCLPVESHSRLPNHTLRPGGPPIFPPQIWPEFKIFRFFKQQWCCLAPIFSPARYEYNLSPPAIFPFRKADDAPKKGAFSSVHKVEIHEHHQREYNLSHVAIKEITVEHNKDYAKTDKAWEDEARALEAIRTLDHPHVVNCLAAIRRGDSRYFMFPWANGDSLRDVWDGVSRQELDRDRVYHAVRQLQGLADALYNLHNFNRGGEQDDMMQESPKIDRIQEGGPVVRLNDGHGEEPDEQDFATQGSIRHGDLKPENILMFYDSNNPLGILKIADLGLAKQHVVATQERINITSMRFGTLRYEAPETAVLQARSRLYDIWSMGCIIFEYIIWLLYGNDQLDNFYSQLKGENLQPCQYFEVRGAEIPRRVVVREAVVRWMDHIERTNPEGRYGSAIRDLLQLVRTRLLVVSLPSNRLSNLEKNGISLPQPGAGEPITRYRATAFELRATLDQILTKTSHPDYLIGERVNGYIPTPSFKPSDLLSPPAANRQNGLAPLNYPQMQGAVRNTGHSSRRDYTLPPLEGWEFHVDNEFAKGIVFRSLSQLAPSSPIPSTLCDRCTRLNFWAAGFSLKDRIVVLEERSQSCEFCTLLLSVYRETGMLHQSVVCFERNQSNLIIPGGDALPVLSIFRSLELNTPFPIQIGLPKLTEPRSTPFYEIIRGWLSDCDMKHDDCQGIDQESLPTRLIHVGTTHDSPIRLIETREECVGDFKYVALSHPWGDTSIHPPFCTLRRDHTGMGRELEKFKQSIPQDQLPQTFMDAIECTRELRIRYLWIDSICILQGPDGDFAQEAKRMEGVFSGAYCVLAASRAKSQWDGFLGGRRQNEFVTFQRGSEKPFYVSRSIDNFSQDVLEGSLNRRGWVLQERALARRTIYFTENQAYFECGNGVRCETMTKMSNKMAAFLGDPKFPDIAMREHSRALRVSWFQDLYKQYSRLAFSEYSDRPFAIAGLEKRLQKAFGTKGGYGIFDDGDKPKGGLFHRSLLWQRCEEEKELVPIDFPREKNIHVPSWSWMAYIGGIDYTDPPFHSADWETRDIVPPWTRGSQRDTDSAPQDGDVALLVTVRDFNIARSKRDEVKIVYDRDRASASDGQRAQCVVVARSKGDMLDQDRRFYVLLVTSTQATSGRGEKIYRRVGAGYMPGKYIALDQAGVSGKIY